MKNVLPVVYLLGFGLGIFMILEADTGLFSSTFWLAIIAGAFICLLFGSAMMNYLHCLHKKLFSEKS